MFVQGIMQMSNFDGFNDADNFGGNSNKIVIKEESHVCHSVEVKASFIAFVILELIIYP